jgi:hypothetical protein
MKDKRTTKPGPVGQKFIDLTGTQIVQYGQIVFKAIFDSDLPLVKSLAASVKLLSTINEEIFKKKLLVFIEEFNNNKIDESEMNRFKYDFENNRDYQEKVLGTIIINIEKYTEYAQINIMTNLLKNYIEKNISWEDFRSLCFCLKNFHPDGYSYLQVMENQHTKWTMTYNSSEVQPNKEALLLMAGVGHRMGTNKFTVTDLGQKLYEFGIKEYFLD